MINAYMAQALGQTLEETTNMLSESLTLRHLAKYGSVNLEEASFYRNLSVAVITEAAEDFIPEEVETADPIDDGEAIELYDAAGNCYLFDPNTGSLTPVDAPEEGDPMGTEGEMSDDAAAQAAAPVVPEEQPAPVAESTELEGAPVEGEGEVVVNEGEGQVVEESTVIEPARHNSAVVAKILANIKA